MLLGINWTILHILAHLRARLLNQAVGYFPCCKMMNSLVVESTAFCCLKEIGHVVVHLAGVLVLVSLAVEGFEVSVTFVLFLIFQNFI